MAANDDALLDCGAPATTMPTRFANVDDNAYLPA